MTPDKTMAKEGRTVADQLQRSLRILVLATVVLYVAIGGLGVKVYLDSKNTTNALCAFRQDLERRVLASTDFLKENPKGIPGVSPRLILQGIENQQRTITALKDLNCKPVELKKPQASTQGAP